MYSWNTAPAHNKQIFEDLRTQLHLVENKICSFNFCSRYNLLQQLICLFRIFIFHPMSWDLRLEYNNKNNIKKFNSLKPFKICLKYIHFHSVGSICWVNWKENPRVYWKILEKSCIYFYYPKYKQYIRKEIESQETVGDDVKNKNIF